MNPPVNPNMTFAEYTAAALRTARKPNSDGDPEMPPASYLLIGLLGELGEVANLQKKIERHGLQVSKEAIRDELGDVLWYLAVLIEAHDLAFEEVAEANIVKLLKRYPNGFVERGGSV